MFRRVPEEQAKEWSGSDDGPKPFQVTMQAHFAANQSRRLAGIAVVGLVAYMIGVGLGLLRATLGAWGWIVPGIVLLTGFTFAIVQGVRYFRAMSKVREADRQWDTYVRPVRVIEVVEEKPKAIEAPKPAT
jgi:hypothetical protein